MRPVTFKSSFFVSPGGRGVGNSRAVTFHLSPRCSGFSRVLILRKSLSPPIPVGGGGGGGGKGEAVDTNDWCII